MKLLNLETDKKTIKDVQLGENVKICDFVNLYQCEIGDNCLVAAFVEIQKGAKIGKNCRIQSHSFICNGVTIEDEVFIGHGVIFINDRNPSVEKTVNKTWKLEPVRVKKKAVIGSGAVIMAGVTIGQEAFVGAGAVVTKDVADKVTVIGNPARARNR